MSELENAGIVRSELLFGKVNAISANSLQFEFINLQHEPAYFEGRRYGKGEVGEFVIIESQINLILGRIIEIKKADLELSNLDIVGRVQLLGSIQMDNLKVTAGIDYYPSINDLIYSAPHAFIADIPIRMSNIKPKVELEIGSIDLDRDCKITVTPEKLFGRHLGILGSTGGGKSFTTARILEECLKHNSRIILLDPTGEYRGFNSEDTFHVHLGKPMYEVADSKECFLPPECFIETDFLALFEPSGKVQGPKFKEAIRSLKIANSKPEVFTNGYIPKVNSYKYDFLAAINDPSLDLNCPNLTFNIFNLNIQIEHECVFPEFSTSFTSPKDPNRWGNTDGASYTSCLPLISRITSIIHSPPFNTLFTSSTTKLSLTKVLSRFATSNDTTKKLLRIDLSGIPFEYKAREIIANCIGRVLLNESRKGTFSNKPIVVFLDEAHNFIGKTIGNEDTLAKLDAFELIAKEGRKFGLNICLATQRPRDITEGVLSQLGTLIVHRLTNDRDREIVERACGEIDKAASDFLPSLQPGEAVIIGNDFPIPLTINIKKPTIKPNSEGANFQENWA
ncbi:MULTISPECIES: ATP-binding protein [Acinetobacter]|uniref:ATP-binding protein n=1 Tax=Acinetobacter TaxID=469 RepID=UPI002005508A|nr:ATP-binding protein [Acinetobacter radioresistens]MCK4081909.1 ATP-binding protein [Acinetobacter radioresistens]MCU4500426.1 ATP-binding protein [Acinetobacter radioresistens]